MNTSFLKNLYRIEWVKVITQLLLLFFLVSLQFSQPDFIHWSLQSVVLLLMSISLSFHLAYIFFLERLKNNLLAHYLVFFFDIIWITILLYFFPSVQALFVFLYLIYILLSGLILERIGALFVAGFTSLCFSLLLAFSPIVEGKLLFLSLGLNNLGFFLVALLSGTLSEQLKSLGSELQKKTKDLQVLKDLNSLIIENMKSGLISFDLNHNILLFNKSAESILDKKIVEGMHLDFLVPEVLRKLKKDRFNSKHPVQHLYRVNDKTKNLMFYILIYLEKRVIKLAGYLYSQIKQSLEDWKKRTSKMKSWLQ